MKLVLRFALLGVMIALVLSLATRPFPSEAQAGGWRVVAAQPIPLDDLIPTHAFLAPDGLHYLYYTTNEDGGDVLCTVEVTSAKKTCSHLPQDFPTGLFPDLAFQPLSISPDGTRIAAVGQPYRFLKDTDLWVGDLSAGTFTNLTDDGYDGALFPTPPDGVAIDIQPVWSPDGKQIAVERTLTDSEGHLDKTTLSIIDAATGAVRDLTLLPGHDTWAMDAGSVFGLAWSPDGKTLAFDLRHADPDPTADGVWLVDVESGEEEALLSIPEVTVALRGVLPDAELYAITPLSWSPDGSRLLFWAGDAGAFSGFTWCFWIDLESRVVKPVPLPFPQDDPRLTYPMQAAWSPEGSMLLVAAHVLGSLPDERLNPLDPDHARDTSVSLYLIDLASGKSTVLGQLPFVPTQPNVVPWGPAGDVLIDGYHLTLDRE